MAPQPENIKVVTPFRNMLTREGWLVVKTHGDEFQRALPDLFIGHPLYGTRWVECKVRKVNSVSLSDAQKVHWPIWVAHKVKIWIVCGEDFRTPEGVAEMKRWYAMVLHKESNVHLFFHRDTMKYGVRPS